MFTIIYHKDQPNVDKHAMDGNMMVNDGLHIHFYHMIYHNMKIKQMYVDHQGLGASRHDFPLIFHSLILNWYKPGFCLSLNLLGRTVG